MSHTFIRIRKVIATTNLIDIVGARIRNHSTIAMPVGRCSETTSGCQLAELAVGAWIFGIVVGSESARCEGSWSRGNGLIRR